MKLLLLHGQAIKASRIKLQEFRDKFSSDDVIVFDRNEDLTTILTNLSSISLFDQERLVIWENPVEELSLKIADSNNLTVIFWFDHEVADKKPIIQWIKENRGQVFYFSEAKEVSIFPFLDLLAAKDNNAFVEIAKLKTAGFDIFYLITMTFYLLRNLVVTPKNAPPFVKQKLEKQRKNFTPEQIKNIYKQVLELDFKLKSGLVEQEQAEFLLVNIFTLKT